MAKVDVVAVGAPPVAVDAFLGASVDPAERDAKLAWVAASRLAPPRAPPRATSSTAAFASMAAANMAAATMDAALDSALIVIALGRRVVWMIRGRRWWRWWPAAVSATPFEILQKGVVVVTQMPRRVSWRRRNVRSGPKV